MIDLGKARTADTNFPIARYREATEGRRLVGERSETSVVTVLGDSGGLTGPGYHAGEYTQSHTLSLY